jgi:hypothetical protein
LLAYLTAPLAGVAVFALVWALPLLPALTGQAGAVAGIVRAAAGILVPAFVLALALSLGVMFAVRARFGGAWWAAASGGVVLYLAVFALLALRVGFATVFAGPFWLGGLVAGGLAHGLVFRALVGPGRAANPN